MDTLVGESTPGETFSHAFVNSVFIKLMEFLDNDHCDELEFPSCLNSVERKYIHQQAGRLGLYSKSRFVGAQRYVTVYKKKRPTVIRKDLHMSLSPKIQDSIKDLLMNPIAPKKERGIYDQTGSSACPQYDNLIGVPKVPNTKICSIDFKKNLPVYNYLGEMSNVILSNQVTLILGDPGTGKTSQIPQHMMEECKNVSKACYMVCTQPSRLAAASTAYRVAFERNEEIGNSIGYESKLERVRNDKTLLTYCSTEVLLRVMMNRKNALQNITHIFVDEVHERDKLLDMLLIALKESLKLYPYLRIVLMAANFNTSDFSRFFDSLAIYYIKSQWHDVETYFIEDIQSLLNMKGGNRNETKTLDKNYNAASNFDNKQEQCTQVVLGDLINYNLILNMIKFVHLTMPKGSILVFVPGFDDIINLGTAICRCTEMNDSMYQIFILHDDVQSIDHKELYAEEEGIRKIIISTDFAETCITVYDVVYVIDVGMIRSSVYSPIADSLSKLLPISKARMERRIIRAGRTQPGKYFLFQNKVFFDKLSQESIPEICVAPIADICLIAKHLAPNMSINKYLEKAIQPPQPSSIHTTVASLTAMEAIDANEALTDIGKMILNFSIEPRLGKIIFYGCVFKCLDPILTIVCCLSSNEIFSIGSHASSKIDIMHCKKSLAAKSFSDHMALLRGFQMWSKKKMDRYVDSNFNLNVINEGAMESIVNIRVKLVAELRAIELIKPRSPGDMRDLNVNSEKWYVIKAALFLGLYPNIAKIDEDGRPFLHTSVEPCLNILPQSVLLNGDEPSEKSLLKIPTEWIMFGGMTDNGMFRHIECNTVVTPMTVVLLGGPLRISSTAVQTSLNDSDSEDDDNKRINRASLTVDNWITVYFNDSNQAYHIFYLKQKFSDLIARKMCNPSVPLMDDRVIETIIDILGEEEAKANLVSPPRIGQRPHKSLTLHNRTMFEPGFKKPPPMTIVNYSSVIPGSNIRPSIQNIQTSKNATHDPILTRYFLLKSHSVENIEHSQKNGLWTTNSYSAEQIVQAASTGCKILLFFCTDCLSLTFYGCTEFVSVIPMNMIRVKWISNTKVVNDGTIEFLKFICTKYQSSWNNEITELSSQCGQYLERLLSHPVMKTSMGRPIQKKM